MSYPIIPFITLAISSTLSPGPNNIMIMALGKQLGFKKSYKYIIGASLGYTVLLIYTGLLNALLFHILPTISSLLGVLGALYLCYLAWSMVRPKTKDSKKQSIIPEDKIFITSFFLQFINPKATLFVITVYSTFVFPYFQDIQRISLVVAFLVSVTAVSLCFWLGLGSALSIFLEKYEKPFNMVMAAALLYCAYAVSGLAKLFI